jgi:hypothetical protein
MNTRQPITLISGRPSLRRLNYEAGIKPASNPGRLKAVLHRRRTEAVQRLSSHTAHGLRHCQSASLLTAWRDSP